MSINANETGRPSPGFLGGLVVMEMSMAGLLALFGISGNILTIRVLQVPNLRKTSTAFYFTALAAVDILVLLNAPATKALSAAVYKEERHFRDSHVLVCKAQLFLIYTMSQISAWILVAVTLDRMVWVVFPFKARQYCTIRRAKIVVVVIICLICIINCRHIWHSTLLPKTLGDNRTVMHCATDDNFIKHTYVSYVDPALVTILPFLVMFIANLLIIKKLREMKAKREKKLHKTKTKKDGSSLTKMLLCTSIFYLVSSLPYLILMQVLKEKRQQIVRHAVLMNVVYAIQVCTYNLFNLNYAIHFLLYCLAGPTFKAEAFKVLKIRQRRRQPEAEEATNGATRTTKDPEVDEDEALELLDEPQQQQKQQQQLRKKSDA